MPCQASALQYYLLFYPPAPFSPLAEHPALYVVGVVRMHGACICQKFQLNFICGIAIESHAESAASHKLPFLRFIRSRLQVKVRGAPTGWEFGAADRAETTENRNFAGKIFRRAVIRRSSARFRRPGDGRNR